MASGQDDTSNSNLDATLNPEPSPEVKPHADAIAANRQQAESLVAAIQENRAAAEQARVDIDAQLDEVSTAVATLTDQLETARATLAEITSLADTARASNAASSETARQASAAVESAKQIASSASDIIGKIEGIRDDAVKTQATIAERNAWIEKGRDHVAKFLQEMETHLDGASRSAASAETSLHAAQKMSEQTTALHANVQATKERVDRTTALHANVQATKERVDSDASAASSARATVEGHAAATKRLAEVASEVEARVAEYEATLGRLQSANNVQSSKIDEILASATDGSLGGAYRKRGDSFKPSEANWQRIFIASLVGLLALAAWQAYTLGKLTTPPDWEQLARMMLFKLPFLIPLVWLAIHAARQASFAKQMEEEYAFKATTSFSFEGYRRQMAEVEEALDANSPLAQLCKNTLKTLADPPRRVYDKQRMDPTPGTAAAEIVGPVVEGVSKTLAKLPALKTGGTG